MKVSRLVDLSMIFFLRHELSREVIREVPETTDRKNYTLKHKNITATRHLVVYRGTNDDDLQQVDSNEFKVYPEDGKIVFNDTQEEGAVIKVDYHYTWIGVSDAFFDDALVPPFVAVENTHDVGRPLELGSSTNVVQTEFFIHIYGKGEGQRDDIIDEIKDALEKDCPIWNFNNGFPIDNDDSINFNWNIKDVVGYMTFVHPISTRRNPLHSNDEVERGRALLTVRAEYYR